MAFGHTLRLTEWRHDGRRVVVPVRLLPPSPSADLTGVKCLALLDTGSTTSGITFRIARELQLVKRGKRPLGSAQGEGQVERYLFRIGFQQSGEPSSSPEFPFIFEEVEGFELMDAFRLGALIGMDILRQCDFHMKRDGLCRLAYG